MARTNRKSKSSSGNKLAIRIKSIEWLTSDQLVANENNFRLHPMEQRQRLRAAFKEIGWTGVLVGRKRPDGKVELIDGHLRKDELPAGVKVPVAITDLSDDEAKKSLLTFDQIGREAEIDSALLSDLAGKIEFDSHDLQALSDDLLTLADDIRPDLSDESLQRSPPEIELQPNEHYDYVLVIARTRRDWQQLSKFLGLKRMRKPQSKQVGLFRGIEASQFLKKVGVS